MMKKMKCFNALPVVVALAFVPVCSGVMAQPAPGMPTTRAEVKMERAEFLRSHVWDETTDTWMLKPGYEAPAGVKTRAQIRAERDGYLRINRWDEGTGQWVSMKDTPRDMAKMSRAEVKAETAAFMRTHRYDEQTETWELKAPPKK